MKEDEKKLEDSCASEICAYRGHGICDYVEGMYCPMYTEKKPDNNESNEN